MLQTKSGNGVKVAKVVQEVQDIISSNEKYYNKVKILKNLNLTGRPDNAKARVIIEKFSDKFRYYKRLNQRVKDLRPEYKLNYYFKDKTKTVFDTLIWVDRFTKRLETESGGNHVIDKYAIFEKVIPAEIRYSKLDKWGDKINMKYRYDLYKDEILKYQFAIISEVRKQKFEHEVKEKLLNEFTSQTGLNRSFSGKERSIFEVQENKAYNAYKNAYMYCIVADYYITVSQDETEDWEAYSKSWHRAHGPKRTIENRSVNFYKDSKKVFSKYVNSFAGNYFIDAIISQLNLPVVKVDRGLAKVQLNKHFSINLVRKIGNVSIYERKLANAHIDYCSFYNNETYHSSTLLCTISGLQRKLKANVYYDREFINKQTGFELGFCETGMKEFCNDNNIDFEGTYSRKELRNITVANRPNNCAKYVSELKKIGIILNCK